jgi:transcriptional regulator with XRE-family HTH domain
MGARIRAFRERSGMSARDLAKALGISVAAINEMQQGRSVKQYVQLREIARLLGVTPNAILGVSEDPPGLIVGAFEALLIEAGWPASQAKDAVGVAMKAAMTEPIAGLDQARSAQVVAAIEWRKRAGK